MWRKMLTAGMAGMLAIAVAACGNASPKQGADTAANDTGTQSSTSDTAQTPAPKTTIQYWTDDRHDQEYIKAMIDQFNATNEDNIEVQMTVLSENYNQSVDVAFASNEAPDVLRLKSGNTETFYKKGYLAPIDDHLDDQIKQKFGSMFIDHVNQFDGKLYSLPNTGLTLRLVYNQDIFAMAGIQDPPVSLQEMVDDAKKITEAGKKDGIYGFALNFKNPKSAFDRSMREILSLSGYQGLGFDVNTGKFDFGPYSQAIEYFKQMYEDGSILPGAETLDIDPLRAQFAAGKIGMYLCFATEPGVYKDQFPTTIHWAGALPPTIDGTRNGTSEIVSAGTWLGISNNSEHKDAAWEFVKYMYGDDILTAYHEQGFGIAVVPGIIAKANNPDIAGMDGFLPGKYDSMWPVSPNVTPEGPNYADAFFKWILAGGDLNSIVEDLNKRYNEALDKAVQKGDVQVTANPSFDPVKLQGKQE